MKKSDINEHLEKIALTWVETPIELESGGNPDFVQPTGEAWVRCFIDFTVETDEDSCTKRQHGLLILTAYTPDKYGTTETMRLLERFEDTFRSATENGVRLRYSQEVRQDVISGFNYQSIGINFWSDTAK